MTLGAAVLILLLARVGIVLTRRLLRKGRKARTVCIVLLALLALFCAVYIGLTIFFVDAVRNQPPALP